MSGSHRGSMAMRTADAAQRRLPPSGAARSSDHVAGIRRCFLVSPLNDADRKTRRAGNAARRVPPVEHLPDQPAQGQDAAAYESVPGSCLPCPLQRRQHVCAIRLRWTHTTFTTLAMPRHAPVHDTSLYARCHHRTSTTLWYTLSVRWRTAFQLYICFTALCCCQGSRAAYRSIASSNVCRVGKVLQTGDMRGGNNTRLTTSKPAVASDLEQSLPRGFSQEKRRGRQDLWDAPHTR